ncbi:MAG: hypothetical protein ACKV0T_24295 [Planctomycetales bacterium]
MKVAILSESPADEAAVKVLLEALLQTSVEAIPRRARAGGWNSVLAAIPPTLKELHYRQTAAALVIVLDSDDSLVHQEGHEQAGVTAPSNCRLCQTQASIRKIIETLSPIPGTIPLKTAVAVAVPAIEAWYRCGLNPACTEAGWVMRQQQRQSLYSEIRKLKTEVYGTDRPGLQLETERAIENARRLSASITVLEQSFPISFGRFAAVIRSWRI